MKKLVSALLATLFLLTALPLGAVSAEVVPATSGTTGDCTWTLDGTHLTISGNGAMENYSTYSVAPWGISITKVILESGVTAIGAYAFATCKELETIEIPEGVTTIEKYAFAYSGLSTIYFPKSLTHIAGGAFNFCAYLSVYYAGTSEDRKNIFYGGSEISGEGDYFGQAPKDPLTAESWTYETFVEGNYRFSGNAIVQGFGSNTTAVIPSVVRGQPVTAIHHEEYPVCQLIQGHWTCLYWANTYPLANVATVRLPKSITSISMYSLQNVREVYYEGSEADRAAMSLGDNHPLQSAMWYYNCCMHEYDSDCDTTCNKCGEEREPQHTYSNACDRDCNVCGQIRVAPHQFVGACDDTCNLCGAWQEPGAHIYDNACDADCNICGVAREPAAHIYDHACDVDCNVCTAIRAVGEHVYDNTCDTACNICGVERTIEHTYDNTCDTACNVCGAEREVVHRYSNACDTDCNICGLVRAVGEHIYNNDCDNSCNLCGTVREVGEHVYLDTCDTDCNICGNTRVPPHNYANACDKVCDTCMAQRPVPDHVYTHIYDPDCDECGAVREVEYLSGDANLDGKVNVRDLALMEQYLNGWDVSIATDICDVNGDDKWNVRDLAFLERYINGWDVELK